MGNRNLEDSITFDCGQDGELGPKTVWKIADGTIQGLNKLSSNDAKPTVDVAESNPEESFRQYVKAACEHEAMKRLPARCLHPDNQVISFAL